MSQHQLIIPDPKEIRPYREIPTREIEEVVRWHHELHQPTRLLLNQAIRIGSKLRNWRALVPHGRWREWCEQNIPQIHERMIRRYIQLWDHREWLEQKLEIGHVSDLEELPSIRQALALLADKRRSECPPSAPAKEKRGTRPREIKVETTVGSSQLTTDAVSDWQQQTTIPAREIEAETTLELGISGDASNRSEAAVRPERIAEPERPAVPREIPVTISADQLAALCPACRAIVQGG